MCSDSYPAASTSPHAMCISTFHPVREVLGVGGAFFWGGRRPPRKQRYLAGMRLGGVGATLGRLIAAVLDIEGVDYLLLMLVRSTPSRYRPALVQLHRFLVLPCLQLLVAWHKSGGVFNYFSAWITL